MPIQQYRQGLLSALSNHYKTYRDLYQVTRKQNDHLKKKEMHSLFKTNGKKENLVESLKLTEKEIENYQQEWGNFKENLSPEDRQKVHEMLENIKSVIRDIMSVESENKELIESHKKEVKKNISKLNANKSKIRKYVMQDQLYRDNLS